MIALISIFQPRRLRCFFSIIFLFVAASFISHAAEDEAAAPPVDFAGSVYPIFERSCLDCHGAKQQLANLRLDGKDAAMKGGWSGAVIQPHNAKSLLVARIAGDSMGPQMPMSEDPLSEQEISTIRAWIEQGADWPEDAGVKQAVVKKHWAYQRPILPLPPLTSNPKWARNPLDRFVLKRLDEEGLAPSPEASKETLIRRVYMDIIGLPPDPKDVDAFLADASANAYETMVNGLLASPHYGERWASHWLDLARFADSHGFEKDRAREIWPYRDWVIQAFNDDKPYDQFTIEQIAGDLLPGANPDQIIATGFNRNSMINEEGGVNQEQYRVEAVIDRTNTTASVWLGSTLACAQCHNHKYDPFTQKNYYEFLAFFNNHAPEIRQIQSFEAQADGPTLTLYTDEERRRIDEIQPQIKALDQTLSTMTPELEHAMRLWDKQARFDQISWMAFIPAKEKQPPTDIAAILKTPMRQRDAKAMKRLISHWLSIASALDAAREKRAQLVGKLPNNVPTTMVMQEMEQPRATHIFEGGSYLSPGEEVTPDVPRVLPPLPPDAPRNRLGLARWLVSERNPLTARVFVNRVWEQLFGHGLVKTTGDFGSRGDPPVNQPLLDYLAVRFMQQNWSMKSLLFEIVASAAYRQQSNMTHDVWEKDPDNRLLARGPRFRLAAELIRDQALAASGLLNPKIGGPSVFPFQPEGIWQMPYSSVKWETSKNGDQYRRGVYTHWQRTAPYPALASFDATSREISCTRRIRTNTPLQALVTLNDPAYFEAAKSLARLMVKAAQGQVAVGIEYGYRRCVVRKPDAAESKRLVEYYQSMLAYYRDHQDKAKQIAGDGPDQNSAELAAWTMTANVILNLDETLNKT